MAKPKIKLGDRDIDFWNHSLNLYPEEWGELIRKLHPITAVVIWGILTNSLTPETLSLAKSSPDWNRFTAVRIVGGGNPKFCKEVAEIAMGEMEEVFEEVLPDYTSRRILH